MYWIQKASTICASAGPKNLNQYPYFCPLEYTDIIYDYRVAGCTGFLCMEPKYDLCTEATWCITSVDIVWIVFTLAAEIYVKVSIITWAQANASWWGDKKSNWNTASKYSLPVVFVFSISKLFPPDELEHKYYIGCSSDKCEKVVHNALMTLVCFPFDLVDAYNLGDKAAAEPGATRRKRSFLTWW